MINNSIQRREKEDNFFVRLQKETLEGLQTLSGKIWTDYNLHDPGVTIAEITNYALYELQYQLQFPIETYLSSGEGIDFEKLGLFSKETITGKSVVTPEDYENLILSTIQGIQNCKITLNKNHKYKITVELDKEIYAEKIINEIEKLYHANRNLCETLGEIVIGKIEQEKKTGDFAFAPEFYKERNVFDRKKSFSSQYYSVQNHFPDNYGLNEKGMPASITDEHRAKIMQLKAYMLIYDHLLANTLHQSGNVNKLLALSEESFPLYEPGFSISKIEELTDKNKFKKNKLQDTDFLNSQKSHFLDFLDVIYGEDTKSFFLHEGNLPEQNRKRMALIRKLPQWNQNRMRCFDIFNEEIENCPLQQLISVILGYDTQEKTSVVDLLAKYKLRLISDKEFSEGYDHLDTRYIIEYLENNSFGYRIETVPENHFIFHDYMFHELETELSFFWYHILFESLLQYGSSVENFRIITNPDTKTYLLVFIEPHTEKWIYLGFSADKLLLIRLANQLCCFLKMFRQQSKSIYLVEHILLDLNPDEYNKLTIVIPFEGNKIKNGEEYESLIRERLPAYIETNIVWLPFAHFYHFEKNYFLWRKALTNKNFEDVRKYANNLKNNIV